MVVIMTVSTIAALSVLIIGKRNIIVKWRLFYYIETFKGCVF
jgi:hypothetical protein